MSIHLTETDIAEIERIDKLYRSTDLTSFATQNEINILNNLVQLLPFFLTSPEINTFNDIIRVSINKQVNRDKENRRLSSVTDLKYPPSDVLDKLYYNRASYKKQSIFYGGFGHFQALFENSPNTGELFTVSTWRQKADKELCFAKIFHDQKIQEYTDIFHTDWNDYLNQLEELDYNQAVAVDKLFSLITFFFTRPIEPSNKIEYLFSAHIANMLFKMPHSPKIEAILYPSVPMEYIATNLAILPDSFDNKFEFLKAEEFIVLNKTEGKNQWMSHKLSESNMLEDNELIWEDQYMDSSMKDFLNKSDAKIDL